MYTSCLALCVYSELYLADVTGALFISALICGTMLPLSIYTAKILLQVKKWPNVLGFFFRQLFCPLPVDCSPTHSSITGQDLTRSEFLVLTDRVINGSSWNHNIVHTLGIHARRCPRPEERAFLDHYIWKLCECALDILENHNVDE